MPSPINISANASTFIKAANNAAMRTALDVPSKAEIKVKGIWVSGSNYVVNDIVGTSDGLYICIANISGGTSDPSLVPASWSLYLSNGGSQEIVEALLENTYTLSGSLTGEIVLTGNMTSEDIISGDTTVEDDTLFALRSESTTARTLAASDAKKYIRCSNSAAVSVTVPPDASVPYAVGTEIILEQSGIGQVTVVAGSGVTIRTSLTLKTRAQYSSLTLKKVAVNEWVAGGDRSVT